MTYAKPARELFDQALVRQWLDYDPATGILTWLRQAGDDPATKGFNNRFAGKRAGRVSKNFRKVGLRGMQICEHDLVWLWMTGELPTHRIEHINFDRTDNSWENLRLADPPLTPWRLRDRTAGTQCPRGVVWGQRWGKWQAKLNSNRVYVGGFDDRDAAVAARIAAAHQGRGA